MERNPYTPTPGSLNTGTLEPTRTISELASRRRRLANLLIDMVAFIVLSLLIAVANAIVFALTDLDLVESTGPVVPFAIFFGYYFVCETVWGRTLGKLMTRTKVLSDAGERLGYRLIPSIRRRACHQA